MVGERVKPMPMKTDRDFVFVKCPYCGRWNEVSFSNFIGIEKDKGIFSLSFYTKCIRCEKEIYYELKTKELEAEVLIEE